MLGNTYGRMFRVTASGESYGEALLTICDGVPPGLPLANEDVQKELDRRRPGTKPIDSPRQETDRVEIVSGMLEGHTTGAPVGMLIRNVDRHQIHVDQYRAVKDVIRPGHAEYTFFVKYGEYADWCGAGRASGRETAGRVAAGAVAKKILARENIEILGFVKQLYNIKMRDMSYDEIKANYCKNDINCPDLEVGGRMYEKCLEIKEEGDTCGGVIEVIAHGVPAGLGEPVFDKLSANLAKALMSIGAVKGFEIGEGFNAVLLKGSQNNDIPYVDDSGRVRFKTNRSGGFLGGISNGEDLVMRIAVKPTATISIAQDSVNMAEMKNAPLEAITRRDPTICARVVVVAEAMAAITILDHLMMWRGYKNVAKIDNKWDPERQG